MCCCSDAFLPCVTLLSVQNSFEDFYGCLSGQDETAIKKHAEISGFPATHVEEIKGTISPATAN